MILVIILIQVPFLIVFAGGKKENTELANPWELIIGTGVMQPARMAAFLNEDFGITGDFSGTGKTHYTTNGGETWTKSEVSGGCIWGMEIVACFDT